MSTLIDFSQYYNEETKELFLPITFNTRIDNRNLPKGIEKIVFIKLQFKLVNFNELVTKPSYDNQRLILTMPPNFDRLTEINTMFNSLLSRTFGTIGFDKTIDYLPEGLTHIFFGDYFNQSIMYLPNSITHLAFGATFNKSVDKLPNSLTHLTMGKNFNRSFVYFPNNLTYLSLGHNFNCSIDNLPCYLEELHFFCNPLNFPTNLPINLKKIKIMNWSNKMENVIKKIPLECIVVDKDEKIVKITNG